MHKVTAHIIDLDKGTSIVVETTCQGGFNAIAAALHRYQELTHLTDSQMMAAKIELRSMSAIKVDGECFPDGHRIRAEKI